MVFDKNKQFKIFADVPPIPDEEHLKKFMEAGFTHYVMTEDYIPLRDKDNQVSKEYLDTVHLIRKLGLKVLLRTMKEGNLHYYDGITTEFSGLFEGYYMCDEPCYEDLNWNYESPKIDNLVNFRDWYNKYGENLFHINLLQSYGVKMLHPNSATYEQYLDKYIDVILKKIKGTKTLATDYYPIGQENDTNIIKDMYLFDLFLIAKKTKMLREQGHDVRTGFCIQTFVDKGLHLRPLTSIRDISFQTYVTTAFGSEHFEYFLYTWEGDGLVPDRKTQKNYSPYWFWTKDVNKEMQLLAPYVLEYKWDSARLYKGEKPSVNFTEIEKNIISLEDDLNDFTLSNSTDLLVSKFTNENNIAYMLVNFSEPSLNMDCDVDISFKNIKEFSIFVDGKVTKVQSSKCKIKIPSGKAVFIMAD